MYHALVRWTEGLMVMYDAVVVVFLFHELLYACSELRASLGKRSTVDGLVFTKSCVPSRPSVRLW